MYQTCARSFQCPNDKYGIAFGVHVGSERCGPLQWIAYRIITDQTPAPPEGLPEGPWYRNLIYAPGRFTGYGAKTLPGITAAIEEERWADANRCTPCLFVAHSKGVLFICADRFAAASSD